MSEAGEERERAAARRRKRRRRGGSGAGRAAQAKASTSRAVPSSTRSGAGQSPRRRESPERPVEQAAEQAAERAAERAAPGGPVASQGPPGAAVPLGPSARTQLAAHELADAQNEDRRRANVVRLRVLVVAGAALPALVLGVVAGVVASVVVGVVVAAVVFVVLALVASAGSIALALRLVGGTPVHEDTMPALVNQVEGLCATIGVVQPELRLVDDAVANACALAGRGGRSVLVVTSGLLARLGLIEMEGVVAHELVHLKRRDAAVSSVAVATAGVVAWATGRDGLVHLAVGRGREYGADQAAVLAVRYPPGLHDALLSMGGRPSGAASPFTGRRWAATRWIWIDPMVGAAEPGPAGELDATVVRVAALAEW